MAKLDAKVNVVVYGDSFARQSPRMNKLQAEEIVNKALGRSADTETPVELPQGSYVVTIVGEPTSLKLSADEPTQPGVKPPTCTGSWSTGWVCEDNGNLAPVFGSQTLTAGPAVRTPSEILAEATNRAEAMLPHGIEVTSGLTDSGTQIVSAHCPHCDKRTDVAAFNDAMLGAPPDLLAETISGRTRDEMRSCIEATCCDPLDRWVDGWRVRECLAKYEAWQRADYGEGKHQDGRYWWRMPLETAALTDLQKAAAQQAWSAQLRARQQEAREKERAQVVCERDEDGL